MWPLLKNGDEIFVSKEVCELKKGDIITVHNCYGRILTHRIIDEIKLITKGDNNVFPEKQLQGTSFKLIGKLEYVYINHKRLNIDSYNQIFYKYSKTEMNVFKFIKRILPFNGVIFFLKKVSYLIFIFLFKLLIWKRF